MKKNLYIATLILGLTAVSCQKQEITPITGAESELPVWESSSRLGEDGSDDLNSDNGNDDAAMDSDGGITDLNNDPDGNISTGEITDPNNDPDGETSTGGEITDPDNDPDGEVTPGLTGDINDGDVVIPGSGKGKRNDF